MQTVTNDTEDERKKKKKRKRGNRRSDWQANQAVIGQAWFDYFKEHKRAPSMAELARKTGFHRNVVKSHVEELDIARMVATSTTRAAAGKVLESYTEKVISDPTALDVKTWFQIHGLKFDDGTGESGAAQTQTFKAYGGFDTDQV